MLIRTVAKVAAERRLPLKLVIVGLRDQSERLQLLDELSTWERRVLSPSRAYVAQEEVAGFYLASDCFVMNSQGVNGHGEGFGRVTIEAMAIGLPVLGTAAGGTKEVVLHEVTGLLFPIGEEGQLELAKHLEVLARDRSRGIKLGEAGRERAVGAFNEDRFLADLRAALSLIPKRSGDR